jgi:hypothetical protein
MATPHERLARMRKSFERNRSVLTDDYKYFTTPDAANYATGAAKAEVSEMSANRISMA